MQDKISKAARKAAQKEFFRRQAANRTQAAINGPKSHDSK